MAWQQLRVLLPKQQLESIEQYLLEQGALSTTYLDAEDQAVFQKEPGSIPLWDNVCLVCLFRAEFNLDIILLGLQMHTSIPSSNITVEFLEEQEWERSWMADFQAMQFGKNLWICPSWQTPPDPDATTIMLDPGLAFGSGSHSTTSLCLQWLEQTPLNQLTVIDYGCGSGVLAIAAALLGAKCVVGIDNDPQAITATKENAKRNNIAKDLITAYLPDELPSALEESKCDILLANILAEPLLQLAEKFAGLVMPKGKIVLSGLLEEQAEQMLEKYQRWFEMDKAAVENDWVRLTGTRKAET
ncbi:MAG: 50S ribosomal protein L11 methyltransferase [SAR86 cluster bacterium]|uniref:Ribosomal protein L11 methyltransferase n=1 Tax=SAR86 cluster bacterium TaxID=2030880 RepID=A0A2A5AJG3_9GAMM|nr:MAG: 50S ribosomal protein L11 methyltransferase [SAR86 cluster bacterium]